MLISDGSYEAIKSEKYIKDRIFNKDPKLASQAIDKISKILHTYKTTQVNYIDQKLLEGIYAKIGNITALTTDAMQSDTRSSMWRQIS